MAIYTEIENNYLRCENEDGSVSFIRMDNDNPIYQAYLRWLENPNADTWTEPQLTKF